MTDRTTALLVDRLTKVYADGTHALDALELRLPAGSFFGLLGPNGAGKTTRIGSVAGLVRAPAGRMFVFGRHAVADPRAPLLLGLAGLASATEVVQRGWRSVGACGGFET